MMETLAVIVFVAGIFTFLYISVIPLIGTYNDLVNRESNIDIVYKLYNIRIAIQKDNKLKSLQNTPFIKLTCSNFRDVDYCNNLMGQMELESYNLFYTNSIRNNIENFRGYPEVYNYLKSFTNENVPSLILMDKKANTIAHLDYYNFI